MTSECLDEVGGSYGDFISPDTTPPLTTLSFLGPTFTDKSGNLFISTQTSVGLDGVDQIVEDAVTSDIAFIGFKVDQTASNINQLSPFISTFTLAPGSHFIVFASSDNAGNAETLRTRTLFVDGTPPGPPINLLANGSNPSPWTNSSTYTLTWNNPPDASGIQGSFFRIDNSTEILILTLQSVSMDFSTQLLNGDNLLSVRLVDNVGNADPNQVSVASLRFDNIPPSSTAASPSTASAGPIPVSFDSSDPGAPATGSGVSQTVLWYRKDTNDDGVFGDWVNAGLSAPGGTGTLAFTPVGDANYKFYTQALDIAGNPEPAPTPATPAKAQTFFDSTPPVLSNIAVPFIGFDQAQVSWNTDDNAMGLVEYGTTTAFGFSVRVSTPSRSHLATLECHVPSPATFFYRITAMNKTGLNSVSPVGTFTTPPQVAVPSDLFGVVGPGEPIVVSVSNPQIGRATFTVDGQTGAVAVSTSASFSLFVDTSVVGSGSQTLTLTLDGFTFQTQFIVDTATRSARLVRFVTDAGGVMTDTAATPGSSMLDLTMGQTAQEPMTSPQSRLFLGYYSGIDPVAPGAVSDVAVSPGPGAGQATLAWTAPGDDAFVGTAMKYDLRSATFTLSESNFLQANPVALSTFPAPAGTAQGAVVSGLADGTTYFFALKTLDELLNVSTISNIASARTLEVSRSTDLIAGQPAVTLLSSVPGISIDIVNVAVSTPAVALATSAAAAQGLIFISSIYDILSPNPSLPGGATIQFRYSGSGLDPSLKPDIRLYHFAPASNQWLLVADIGPDTANNVLTAPVFSLSFFALFIRDRRPPITALNFINGKQFTTGQGQVFASTHTLYTLAAFDPPLGPFPGSGVLRTEFRLDTSQGNFSVFTSPFGLTEGLHTIQFRSIDRAGNIETTRSFLVGVDGTAPDASLSTNSPFIALPDGLAVLTPTGTITATVTDPVVQQSASGVGSVQFSLDQGSFTLAGSSFSVALGSGLHTLRVLAQDNVGNASDRAFKIVVGDIQPPRTTPQVGLPRFMAQGSTFTTSATLLGLTAVDDLLEVGDGIGLGVDKTFFAVDSDSFTVFTTSITISGDGIHAWKFFSRDVVGNVESTQTVTLNVDNTPPITELISSGQFFVDSFARKFASPFFTYTLKAQDPVVNQVASGVAFTKFRTITLPGTQDLVGEPSPPLPPLGPFDPSAPPFSLDEGVKRVDFQSQDNVLNLELLKSATIFVDATPPLSALLVGEPRFDPGAGLPLVVSALTTFTVTAADPLSRGVASGLQRTQFRVSSGTFMDFTMPFTLSPPDRDKAIGFRSQDNVGNLESEKTQTFTMDSTPPFLALISPPPRTQGVCSVFKGRFPVLGRATDLHFKEYNLEFAPGRDAVSGFVLISSGTVQVSSGALGVWDTTSLSGFQTLRLTALDQVANASSLTATVFIGDPTLLLSLGDKSLFNKPQGVATDSLGNIYVSDTGNNLVKNFSSTGTLIAQFNGLTALVSPKKTEGKKEEKEEPNGIVFNKPLGLALDPAGNIFVADRNNNRIVKLSSSGVVLASLGRTNEEGMFIPGKGPGEFNKPTGVALDSQGNIYVADRNNGRVQKLSPQGAFLSQILLDQAAPVPLKPEEPEEEPEMEEKDKPQSEPFGVALDLAGNIYVTDEENDRVLKFDPAGKLLLSLGGIEDGKSPGQFNKPQGIAVNQDGTCILVSDRNNDRVQKFDLKGNLTLVFGMKGEIEEGPPAPAGIAFNKPAHIFLDPSGNLFVADRNNDRIQKFGLEGPTLIVSGPKKEEEKDDEEEKYLVQKSKGGRVKHSREGAQADIPAGSLDQDLVVSVKPGRTAPSGQVLRVSGAVGGGNKIEPVTPGVEFGPEGTQFTQPVTIALPYDPSSLNGTQETGLVLGYWNPALSGWEALPSAVDLALHVVKAQTTHFSLYAVLGEAAAQAVDGTFRLGEVYSFPNPARGGKSPTLHIEVGIADSVAIRIYDMSGELVHQTSLSGAPQVIADGQGPQYAYEYTWQGYIPTGVYLYVVEANSAGRTLKKAGRLSVVR